MTKKATAPKAKKPAAKPKTPKTPKAAAAAPAGEAKVEVKHLAAKLGSDFKCPAEAEVVALVRRLKTQQKVAQEKAGEMGEMVAKAVETKHFDRKALSIVRGLESMSDNKLQTTLPHLLMYIDALGLTERAKRQGQLLAGAAGGDGEADDDGDSDGETVSASSHLRIVPTEGAGDFDDEATAVH
jgi:hypothetical protein